MSIALKVVGIATKNMAESLKYYRLLGLEIPEGQHYAIVSDPDGNLISLFA